MKKRFIIRVQSFSDVITNSSSELFVVEKNGKTAKELEQMLYDYKHEHNEVGSGMGGSISVEEMLSVEEHINASIDSFFQEVGFASASSHYDRSKKMWVPDETTIITEERKKEIINYEKLHDFVLERMEKRGFKQDCFIIDIDNNLEKTIEFIKKDLGGVLYE